jgi:hypothetical protein
MFRSPGFLAASHFETNQSGTQLKNRRGLYSVQYDGKIIMKGGSYVEMWKEAVLADSRSAENSP